MKTPITQLEIVDVVSFPKELAPGQLYVSDEFESAAHLCCCGCGNKVVTPLSAGRWTLRREPNGTPSLTPSVGNTSLPCRSHYFVRAGEVRWAGEMTDEEHRRAINSDRTALDAALPPPTSILGRVRRWILKLFGR